MKQRCRTGTATRLGYVIMAALVLTNSGCLLVAAGAAGGAAVGYAYYKGKVCQFYNASLPDAYAATRTALTELGMPLGHEEHNQLEGSIESRTGDGEQVRIHFETVPSKIPAEGTLTRVCVRVATFGDGFVSERILDQIGAHLAPPGSLAPPAPPTWTPAQAAPAQLAPAQPVQPAGGTQETAPPPLLSSGS
jgi:hypothetical protein